MGSREKPKKGSPPPEKSTPVVPSDSNNTLTLEVITTPVPTVASLVAEFKATLLEAVHSHMSYAHQLGRIALKAKLNLSKEDFKTFREQTKYGNSMFYKILKVAEDEHGILEGLKVAGMLPPGFAVQSELLHLPKPVIEDAVKKGLVAIGDESIKPLDLGAPEVKALRRLIDANYQGSAHTAGAGKGDKTISEAAKPKRPTVEPELPEPNSKASPEVSVTPHSRVQTHSKDAYVERAAKRGVVSLLVPEAMITADKTKLDAMTNEIKEIIAKYIHLDLDLEPDVDVDIV